MLINFDFVFLDPDDSEGEDNYDSHRDTKRKPHSRSPQGTFPSKISGDHLPNDKIKECLILHQLLQMLAVKVVRVFPMRLTIRMNRGQPIKIKNHVLDLPAETNVIKGNKIKLHKNA